MLRIAITLAAVLSTALTAAPAASAGPGLDGFERALIAKLNDARAQNGLAPLRAHRGLSRAADTHSGDMLRADFFDHPSSDGTPFDRRVRRFADVDLVGETLASLGKRHGGAATVVQMWLDSPPHRAIVLRGDFRRIGVARRWGTLGGSRSAVVTADFASRR
jgi:uncharacterized protein YkwD